MKKLLYILYLLPLLSIGQMVPFGFFEDEAGCTADANEQFTTANAMSDPNCNESNATTGLSVVSGTVTSVTTDPQVGSYHISGVASTTTFDRIEYTLTASNGDTFDISFKAKKLQAGTAGLYNFVNATGLTTQLFTESWADYSTSFTATGNVTVRFYINDSAGAVNDEIYVDNLSIVKTN